MDIADAATLLFKIVGAGVVLVFLFVVASLAIGTKPWKEEEE